MFSIRDAHITFGQSEFKQHSCQNPTERLSGLQRKPLLNYSKGSNDNFPQNCK